MAVEAKTKCAFCDEELGPNPVYRGEKAYCCEACAYEAARAADCAGRTDAAMSAPAVESRLHDK
jgi:hypothetical protein